MPHNRQRHTRDNPATELNKRIAANFSKNTIGAEKGWCWKSSLLAWVRDVFRTVLLKRGCKMGIVKPFEASNR